MPHRLALVLSWLLVLACAPSPARRSVATGVASPIPIPDAGPAEREVVAAVERLFEGMRTRDTATLRALLAPDLMVFAVREPPPGGAPAVVRHQSVPDFLRAIAGSTEELRERIWSPEVRLDGAVATLWAPYDFHRGSRFSHCGHDAFQLVRTDGRWVVTGLTYTVRPAPCAGSPTGR